MADLDLTAFYGQFRDEAWETLNLLEQGLTTLEAQPGDATLLDRMLRAVHTTKGSAKIMGFIEINRLAHQVEEVLGAIRKGDVHLSPEVGDILLQASSGIRALTSARIEGEGEPVDIDGLVATMQQLTGTPEPTPETVPVVTVSTSAASRPHETMRVDLEQVDRLARLVGEILTLQAQTREEQYALHELTFTRGETTRALVSLKERLEAYRHRFRPLQAEEVFQRLDLLESLLQQLTHQQRDFVREHETLRAKFSLAVEEAHQQTLTIRMVPISTLFEVFPGVMRRLASDCGVEVSLEIRGAEVELDRRVLDHLREPLIHLVRNALAHGIEPPQEREKSGKPRRGRVLLEARQQGRRVLIRVEDDGRGIDLEKVQRTAQERGLLSEQQTREADERTLLEVLFRPAFTTRRRADDMSGRGVGLDVVQTTMRQLNGIVQVQTGAGQGTIFVLDVPLTLATIRVLLVEVGGETLAVPAATIRSLTRLRPEDVIPVGGRPTLCWQEQTLPLVALGEALGLPAAHVAAGPRPTIIVGTNGHQVGLTVDRLLDETEVVVRSLGEILGQSPYFSAAALSGTGQVIPILDLTGLLSTRLPATRSVESPPIRMAPPSEPALILLVEDALTTRELERSILEAAGYRVETAFDGLDALQKLEQDDFHLVITDIEMPHMDGFELTVRLRQDPRWSGLPVVIISVREDEESRRMGLQSGAQAYIAKRRFDQSDLLETIAQLVG